MDNLTYQRDRTNLLKAIDIALYCFKVKPMPDLIGPGSGDFTDSYLYFKELLLKTNPLKGNKRNLRYHEESIFTFFNEGTGPTVELFWSEVKRANLPFERKNLLPRIIKRKRIKDEAEYNYVKDALVPMFQEGNITQAEFDLLSLYIDQFEASYK